MHPEAITSQAKNLLPKFGSFKGFYLAGGTALALQLGHRVSVDFDWFSDQKISSSLPDEVSRIFSGHGIKIEVNNPAEFTALIGGVKTTFLHYPFPMLLLAAEWEGMKLAQVLEIAAMKAYTIGRRSQLKDYIDIYAALNSGVSLKEVVAAAEKKFGENFSSRLFLEQLVYLGDVDEEPIQFLWTKVSKKELQGFFEKEISVFKF